MELAFYLGLLSLFYCYLGYPLLLGLLFGIAGKHKRVHSAEGACPSVAILLSVYNEESRIQRKIDNFQALDYPDEKLEFWIGLDGSTDATGQIVEACGDQRIHCVTMAGRSGKTAVLNRLAERIEAEVLVFTDVNAMFRPNALRELVAVLQGPRVGLVSGRTVIRGAGRSAEAEGIYYRYESWLKAQESLHGCLTGADGAIYAMWGSLYEELRPELINDFSHPCQVVLCGYSARFAAAAICEEAAEGTAGQELRRQTRMVAQALYGYFHYIWRILRGGRWRYAWMLTSHKLLRWLGFLWIFLLAAGTVALAGRSLWAQALLALEAGLLALAGTAALLPKQTQSRLFQLPLYFLLVHLAYLRGTFKYLAGERYVTWEPRAG